MAAAVARDIPEGWFVNLGSGIPSLVADYVPSGREVVFRSEQTGQAPEEDAVDRWLLDAMALRRRGPGQTADGAADGAVPARAGLLDLCVLSAFEVGENGDLANEAGGEMEDTAEPELSFGVQRLWAVMEHTTRDGRPRLVRSCDYPMTAPTAVSRVYTNLAVLDVTDDGFAVRELAPGVDFATVQAKTDAKLVDAR